MIVIRVELWSAISGQKSELARMVIDNTGGTNHLGNYRCRTLRGRSASALDRAMVNIGKTGTQREGRVVGHPRLREHVWNLVAKALTGMGYGAAKDRSIRQVVDCPKCDGTGYKDHAGFAMDPCDHG